MRILNPRATKRRIRLAGSILFSLILGFGYSLSFANHFLEFWNRRVMIQMLYLILAAPIAGLAIYISLFQLSLPFLIEKPNWKKSSWLIGVGLIGYAFWALIQVPTPMPSYTYHLEITAGGDKDANALARHICLIEVVGADGRAIPFYEFSRRGTWEETINPTKSICSKVEQPAALIMNIRAKPNEQIGILFFTDPNSGKVTVKLNNFEQRIDLFNDQPEEHLVLIKTPDNIYWNIILIAFDLQVFDTSAIIFLLFLLSIGFWQGCTTIKEHTFSKKALLVFTSLLIGFFLALIVNIQLLDLWELERDLQITRMILFSLLFGTLAFVLIAKLILNGFSGYSPGVIFGWILLSFGSGLWCWYQVNFSQPLPISEYTLKIISEGMRNPLSWGNEICLIRVRDGQGHILPINDFYKRGDWYSENEHLLCTSTKGEPGTLQYRLNSEPNQKLQLLFRSSPYAGIVRVRLGDNEQVIDLYREVENDKLLFIDTKMDWLWSSLIPASFISSIGFIILTISIAIVTSYPVRKTYDKIYSRLNEFEQKKIQKLRFIIRCQILILVVVVSQTLIVVPKKPERVARFDDLLAQNNVVLYFGDSVLYYAYQYEHSHQTIPEFLVEAMPETRIGAFYGGAFHMDLYYAMCKYLIIQGHRPELIIIPINLRSFSPTWDLRPAYQFLEEKLYLLSPNDLIRNWAYVFYRLHLFDGQILSNVEFDNLPIYFGEEKVGTIEAIREDISIAFGSQYMYRLSPQHRLIKSMLKLTKLLRQNDIPVLFYITPINVEFGKGHIGDRFDDQVLENISLIKDLLGEEGISMMDLSYSLQDDYFIYSRYPDEHLSSEGRQFVAQQLAARIQAMLLDN